MANTNKEQELKDIENFSWCAMMALHFAHLDGHALSPLMEHSFLQCWLVKARKQRRFPRTVAESIDCLIELGRKRGPNAMLGQRLEALWNASSAKPQEYSHLSRLSKAISNLCQQGWKEKTIQQNEWESVLQMKNKQWEASVFIRDVDLVARFSDNGVLLESLEILVTGNPDLFSDTCLSVGLNVKKRDRESYIFMLYA